MKQSDWTKFITQLRYKVQFEISDIVYINFSSKIFRIIIAVYGVLYHIMIAICGLSYLNL